MANELGGLIPPPPQWTAGNVTDIGQGLSISSGTIAATASGSGSTPLFSAYTPVSNTATTVAEVLQSYTLPANTLSEAGQALRITAGGTIGGFGDTATLRVILGSETLIAEPGPTAQDAWWLQFEIAAGSSSLASGAGALFFPGTIVPKYFDFDATWNEAQVIEITGQSSGGNAEDVMCAYVMIESLPA